MKLLTKEIEQTIPKLYSQEHIEDPIIRCKYFTPDANWTWYVLEGEREGEDFRFFGYVEGFENELGYFMLSELEGVRGPFGLPIERDLYFDPQPLSNVKH